MVTRDLIKLTCLLAVTMVCVISFFTSLSISMMTPSMRVVAATDAKVHKFCTAPMKAAKECEDRASAASTSGKEDCHNYHQVAKKCDRVVRNAFRHINMGGCPKQIKLLTLCEEEWCHQDPKSCNDECAGVRKNFSSCVQETIENHFKRNGLKVDGTI